MEAKSAAMPFLECPAALDGLAYPGNVGFDPLGLSPKYLDTPEKMKAMRTKELNNGRLAMVSVAGFIFQELLDNQQLLEHLNNDDASPIAAFLRKLAP